MARKSANISDLVVAGRADPVHSGPLKQTAGRLTLWAWGRLAQYLLLPFFGGLLALDIIFYLIFRYGFDACYGVLCLLE
jgi:hypothetical protein